MSIWGMRLAIAVCGAAVTAASVWCERDLAADDRLDAGFGTGSGKFESAKQIAAVGDRDGRHRLAAAQLHQFLGFDCSGRQRISAVHAEMDKIGERHGVSMKSWPDLKMAWRNSEYTLLSPGLEDAAAAVTALGIAASVRLESVGTRTRYGCAKGASGVSLSSTGFGCCSSKPIGSFSTPSQGLVANSRRTIPIIWSNSGLLSLARGGAVRNS